MPQHLGRALARIGCQWPPDAQDGPDAGGALVGGAVDRVAASAAAFWQV